MIIELAYDAGEMYFTTDFLVSTDRITAAIEGDLNRVGIIVRRRPATPFDNLPAPGQRLHWCHPGGDDGDQLDIVAVDSERGRLFAEDFVEWVHSTSVEQDQSFLTNSLSMAHYHGESTGLLWATDETDALGIVNRQRTNAGLAPLDLAVWS